MQPVVNLLHEIGMLANMPRSGFAFLGSGKQSVAEHSFRVALIAHVLSKLIQEPINHDKLMMICLFHDLPESRTGDMNYFQKKYVKADLNKALHDIEKGSTMGPEIVNWIKEYESDQTLEAHLAHDADQLELILVLKKEQEMGNPKTADWFHNCFSRLKTEVGKQLAEAISTTSSDDWWKKILKA